MVSGVKVLQADVNIGVIPRSNLFDYQTVASQYDNSKKITTIFISADANEEYNITEKLIGTIAHGEVYDQKIKVLEWHYDANGGLLVECYTDSQVNLFADLSVKNCLIKAQGPLFIKGKLVSESTIVIEAEALWLAESLQAAEAILLTAQQSVSLLGPLRAAHLIIHTAYVHQEAELVLSGQLDISTQSFKQSASIATTVNSLRLLASVCEIRGNLTVNGACLLIAEQLIFGEKRRKSILKLTGNNHLHAHTLHILGDTHVLIGQAANNQSSILVVDQDFLMNKVAHLDLYHTAFFSHTLENKGELSFQQCKVETQILNQEGILDSEQSLITVAQDFNHQLDALTTLKSSIFISLNMRVLSGQFILENCNLKGQSCEVTAGFFHVQNQSEINANTILFLPEAHVIIQDSLVIAHQSMQSASETLFENMSLVTDYWITCNNTTTIKHSQIKAQNQIEFSGAITLTDDSDIAGKFIVLEGELTICDVRIEAKYLKLMSERATINSLYANSETLHLQGSTLVDEVVFKDSVLTTNKLSALNHATFEYCAFYGISQKNIEHNLQARLKMHSSNFLTASQLTTSTTSQLELEGFSTLQTGLLHSKGTINAKDSTIVSTTLWQEQAVLNLDASAVFIEKTLDSQASAVQLAHGSFIYTPLANLGAGSTFKLKERSVLAAPSAVMLSSDSTLESDASTIVTQKFTARGRTELSASLLNAAELVIYEQFTINNHSTVNVDELISAAKNARAQFSDSTVVSNNFDVLGEVLVRDAVLVAKNKLAVKSSATLTLEGNASILAQDMVVDSALVLQENAGSEGQKKAVTQLIINGQLQITKEATVNGTTDLLIEANQYSHAGGLTLSGNLRVRGDSLHNFGSLKADNLYLGFDDKVANFGTLSAAEMTVHSNFLNLAGQVYVDKSLSMAGFYGANLGLIAANNYSNTTLLSFNGGLVLPNLSTDFSHIFSLGNCASVAYIAATTYAPNYSNMLNLAYTIPTLIRNNGGLQSTYENFSWTRFNTMRRHEWMPQICQFKGVALTAMSAFDSAYATPNEVVQVKTDLLNLADWTYDAKTSSFRSIQSAATKLDWQNLIFRTGGIFLGNYYDNSLVNINLGVSLAPAMVSKSLINLNAGAEASLFSHIVDSKYLLNSGWSVGEQATFLSEHTYNTGVMEGFNQFTFKAEHAVNKGLIAGNRTNVVIGQLNQDRGQLVLHNGQATIIEYTDTAKSRAEFVDMEVIGAIFDVAAHLEAERTRFIYTQRFKTKVGSTAHTNQVTIQTHEFLHGGELKHQEGLLIEASKVHLEVGSVINGKKTAQDQLFVPKKEGTSASAEEQKEFKPQHVLTIKAKEGIIDGELSGGDYTTINGIPLAASAETSTPTAEKCKSLIIGKTAKIDLTYGAIAAEKSETSGHATFKHFEVKLDHNQINAGGELTLEDSVVHGQTLANAGVLNLERVIATISEQINLNQHAHEVFKDCSITTGQFIDNSQLAYGKQVAIFTNHYEHGGKVKALALAEGVTDKNLFFVKSKTHDLHGEGEFDQAIFDFENFPEVVQFAAGTEQYRAYHFNESLMVQTPAFVNLDTPFYRNCDLIVKGSGIKMTADYNWAKNLTLISTVTDVSILSKIANNNLYVKSAGKIWNYNTSNSVGEAHYQAVGGFYNVGGEINAKHVAVKASEIKNAVATSRFVIGRRQFILNRKSGIINGSVDTHLEATEGDIVNEGGMIRGGVYTQLVAKGKVINQSNVRFQPSANGPMPIYEAGLITGGSGTAETKGIGLYIKAGGKIEGDASDFVSNGINYLEADQGFDFQARQHTYVAKQWTTKKWYGAKKQHVEVATAVKGTLIHSGAGKNILVTEHGGVNSVATCFSSLQGTEIYARDDIKLYRLQTESRKVTSSSKMWGLYQHNTLQIHQNSTPTLFLDNGVTRITSLEGLIDAGGAYFGGSGDLYMKALKRIKFGVDTLNHEIVEKKRSLGFSAPGMSAWQTKSNNGTLLDIGSAEDATLAKLNDMYRSKTTGERLANAVNLGVNLYNTTNSVMRGLANDTLGKEVLARYGLGGAQGFSPTINLSLTESKTKTHYQTQGLGGVNRGGNVYLEAGEGIDMENGVKVHAHGQLIVDTPELILKVGTLNFSRDQKTTTQSVAINTAGQPQSVSLAHSHQKNQATHVVLAELSAGGNVILHHQGKAINQVILDGGRIVGNTVDAKIENLVIIDRQDTSSNIIQTESASSSGQVSAYHGHGHSAITPQHSGIVVTGEDTKGHTINVGKAYMEGGELLTGQEKVEITQVVAKKVVDHQVYHGAGISFNTIDLARLTGEKATNVIGEQAIAIAETHVDRLNYQAENTPVIYGAPGIYTEIKEQRGQIHTESTNGTKVIKNDELHLTVDLPITNRDYLEKSRENIQAGFDKIAVAWHGNNAPEVELPLVEKYALPAKRIEEEEEEEEIGDSRDNDKLAKGKKLETDKNNSMLAEQEKAIIEIAIAKLAPADQKEVKDLFSKATRKEESGKNDPTKSNELERRLKSAILQAFKAGSEDSWREFSKRCGPEATEKLRKILSRPGSASKLEIKTFLRGKGLLINLCFNLSLKSVEGEKHIVKQAIASVAGDMSFDMMLTYAAGAEAGPIGSAFVGLGILDTIFYDQKAVDRLLQRGLAGQKEGHRLIKEGKLVDGASVSWVGVHQINSAGEREGIHFFMTLPSELAKGFVYVWDKTWRHKPEAATPPTYIVNKNSFFQPRPQITKNEAVPDSEKLALEKR